jgi:hypothetical protein
VVLDEAGGALLEGRRPPQVAADAGRVALAEEVVQLLVVDEVEAFLVQPVLQPPVRLGEEQEARLAREHGRDRRPPEALQRRLRPQAAFPCPRKDVRQHEHGHVAADAVALGGDAAEDLLHGLASGAARVVDLGGVGPGREVRVAAVGDDGPVARAEERRRVTGEVFRRAAHEGLGLLAHQPVVARGVVGDEIQDDPDAQRREPRAEDLEAAGAADLLRDLVAGHRVRGPDDVGLGAVGQGTVVFGSHPGIVARDPDRLGPRRPDPHQPDGVEAEGAHGRDLLVGDGGEGDLPPVPHRQLVQPHARVDLVDQRVAWPADCHQRILAETATTAAASAAPATASTA